MKIVDLWNLMIYLPQIYRKRKGPGYTTFHHSRLHFLRRMNFIPTRSQKTCRKNNFPFIPARRKPTVIPFLLYLLKTPKKIESRSLEGFPASLDHRVSVSQGICFVAGLPTSDVAHLGGVGGAGEHDVPWTFWW